MTKLPWCRAAFAVLAVCFLLPLSPATAQADAATVGIYRDEGGSSCSFSNLDPGLVTAHVVFRPDARGFRAVRFSAPVPSCFDAVWLQDIPTERVHIIGDSQTGISIASSWCEDAPINILQINYYHSGGTTACCEFPVLADPYVGIIEAIDCNQESFIASGATAYMNADSSCNCGFNTPPHPPSSPSPTNGETAASVFTPLSWLATDDEFNLSSFDLYLGTDPNPPLHAPGLTQPSFQPAVPFGELTTFYWRVVARDDWGVETPGPVWAFTTRLANSPPGEPFGPNPVSGSTGILLGANLAWQCQDIDGETLVYDVYFGTTTTPPRLAEGISTAQYTPTLTWDTYYYWQIVARDPQGHETTGPLWGFRTRPENWPPEIPWNPLPPNGATARPITAGQLTWSCSDRDAGDVLVYDVYFGTTSPPPLVATGRTTKSYSYSTLIFNTQYYWRIVARDNHGVETSGSVWTFNTITNLAPQTPSSPSPANLATGVSLVTALTWQCLDPNGDALRFDVFFGTSATPPQVATNISAKTYTPGTLAFTTTYYWRVVARDPYGAQTMGPTWSFTTKADGSPPAPSSPSPANLATNISTVPTLTWVCTDPDAQALTFDVYFGATDPPGQVATNIATKSYAPGVLALTTRYYWRIVARDPGGRETSSATWLFNTRANTAPSVPTNPTPSNSSQALPTTVLKWNASDPDGQALTYDVYFGNTSSPPLAASGLTEKSYAPGVLQAPGTQYFWKVVVSDGLASTSGPLWAFTTVIPGDVDMDGLITTADAKCVMDRWLGLGSCGSYVASDVDCSSSITPRDARCIHRRATGMECAFCGEGGASPMAAATPGIGVMNTWEWNDTLYCRLGVWNVPSFESFGFVVTSGATFIRAQRRAITNNFAVVRSRAYGWPGIPSLVGGYSLTGAPTQPSVASEFIDLRFLRSSTSYWVRIDTYTDDLVGAPTLEFYLSGGGIPVLFTRFDATSRRDGVEIAWQLQSDEAMEEFTLYRRADGAPPVAVARGDVVGTTGRHLDASVSAGSTYEYELVIRSTDGDEFRSQVRRVTVAPLELTLGTNHPNPFNPQTTIPYTIPPGSAPVRVKLAIYDTAGRLVRVLVDEEQTGGARDVVWRGDDASGRTVTSGVYFCVLQVDRERRTRKLVLLK